MGSLCIIYSLYKLDNDILSILRIFNNSLLFYANARDLYCYSTKDTITRNVSRLLHRLRPWYRFETTITPLWRLRSIWSYATDNNEIFVARVSTTQVGRSDKVYLIRVYAFTGVVFLLNVCAIHCRFSDESMPSRKSILVLRFWNHDMERIIID